MRATIASSGSGGRPSRLLHGRPLGPVAAPAPPIPVGTGDGTVLDADRENHIVAGDGTHSVPPLLPVQPSARDDEVVPPRAFPQGEDVVQVGRLRLAELAAAHGE